MRLAVGDPGLEVNVLGVLRWDYDQAVADNWRVGRVLLAGDAAHRFPPHGAFGMNSGVQDANNLAWKLIHVLRGRAGEGLLDTFEDERKPVAEDNSRQALANTQALADAGWHDGRQQELAYIELPDEGRAVRDRIAAAVSGQRAHLHSEGQQFGTIYQSDAVVPDGTEPVLSSVSEYRETGHPGARAPHVWLRRSDGERLSTLDIGGSGFVLLAGARGQAWLQAAVAAAERHGVEVTAQQIGGGSDLAAEGRDWESTYGVAEDGAVLVRPDGHIGARFATAPTGHECSPHRRPGTDPRPWRSRSPAHSFRRDALTETTVAEPPAHIKRPGPGSRVMDAMTRRLMGLSHRKGGYRVARAIPVPTRDGIQLMTDHYIPEGTANGTILMRGPYGRGFPINTTFGALFAGAGFHVLIQSVRGTFGSTGTHEPFVTEASDGQDTVAWLRTQPWFDGRLALMGGSYLGLCAWALLEDPPPELRACVIVVGPHDFAQAMYGTGAFSLAMGFGWSEAMATQEMGGALGRLSNMLTAEKRTHPGLHDLPLARAAEPLMHGRAPWYNDWLTHEDPADSFWEGYRHPRALQKVEVPTLLVGGWQDIFLDQTIEQYRTLHDRQVDVALTVGPWTHLETVGKGAGFISRESLDWLDHHLAGETGGERDAPVHLFVTGAEEWRSYPDWPPAAQPDVYNIDDDGVLGRVAGGGTSTFVFDPADPTPAVGGPLLHPRHAGVKDNRDLEARSDVVTFTSSPLSADMDIIGTPQVELELQVDNPHADVFVRLCDVDSRGRSGNFTDALQRLDPSVPAGEVQRVTLPLRPCAHRLLAGHSLRLQVSGGAHPRYVRNYGTGEPLTTGETLVPCAHTVLHAGTRVTLPIPAS